MWSNWQYFIYTVLRVECPCYDRQLSSRKYLSPPVCQCIHPSFVKYTVFTLDRKIHCNSVLKTLWLVRLLQYLQEQDMVCCDYFFLWIPKYPDCLLAKNNSVLSGIFWWKTIWAGWRTEVDSKAGGKIQKISWVIVSQLLEMSHRVQ